LTHNAVLAGFWPVFQQLALHLRIAPIRLSTTEAYNVSAHFPLGSQGLTNFLHLHPRAKRLYGKGLATAGLGKLASERLEQVRKPLQRACRRIQGACPYQLNSTVCA
jgi:hypothetical protein